MNTATESVFDILTGLPEITEEALAAPDLREYVEDYIDMSEELDWLLGKLDEVNWLKLEAELSLFVACEVLSRGVD